MKTSHVTLRRGKGDGAAPWPVRAKGPAPPPGHRSCRKPSGATAHRGPHPSPALLAGTAEPVIEQVVGLEFREGTGALPPSITQDLGHRQLGVVVEDALGHSAQDGEGRYMAVQERLGGSPPGRP